MLSGVCTIIHSLVIPIFILIFITFYQPRGIHELLDMEHADFAFNTTIIFCITLVSTSITRSITLHIHYMVFCRDDSCCIILIVICNPYAQRADIIF